MTGSQHPHPTRTEMKTAIELADEFPEQNLANIEPDAVNHLNEWGVEAVAMILQQAEQIETERMKLVACGVVAMADTPDSARIAREMHADYKSASLNDVIRRVDECIVLRSEVQALKAALNDAATSLNTISRLAGNEFYVGEDGERVETCMKHPDQIRGYAQSRYSAAIDAMKGKS